MRTLSLIVALACSAPAWAGEYYLEGPAQSSRAAATQMSDATTGDRRGRVVRRFTDGSGWTYVLRIEGFDDDSAARIAAQELADDIGSPVQVYAIEGDASRRLVSITPSIVEPDESNDIDWLARAIDAHGLKAGTLEAMHQGPTLLRYQRTLPDGSVIDHTWATRGGAVYVDIQVVKGSAKASRILVSGDLAWLSVAGGEWTDQNVEKTRMTLAALGPGAVVPFVLALGSSTDERRELEGLEAVGTGEVAGEATRVLRFDGDRTSGPITVELGASDDLIRRVEFAEGVVEHRYSDPQVLSGLRLPTRVETRRGGDDAVDTVTITELSGEPELPDAWFDTPR